MLELWRFVKVAIYARVSTADGRQETQNQLRELRRFARSQRWQIEQEYIDEESGKTANRAGFRQLFTDAARRRFDVVLFWSLDRFTREGALPTLQHLNLLSSYGVGYRSFSEPYLDSCGVFKDAIIAILGTIAKQERLRIAERVRAGMARAKADGRQLGRRRLVFDRREICRLRDENGLSWAEIAARTGLSAGTVRRACAGPGGGLVGPEKRRNPI